MAFLAGMPEQDFRSSIETNSTEMEVLSVSGSLTCYWLQEGPLQAGLQTASAFAVNHGQPWNFTADDFAPCFSSGLGGALLMVQGSGYVMRKISDDPYEVLELPLEPPPSGVYVNDEPVPGLGGVTVKIDDKSECSAKIAVTGGISLKFSGAVFEEDEGAQRRCYRLVNPNSRCRTAGLPVQHFLTKLGWNLVQLCRDSRLVTYLVLDGVTIRLRQKGSVSSKRPVSATSLGSEDRPIEVEAINSPREGEGSAYEVTPVANPTQDGPVISLPSPEPSVSGSKVQDRPNFDVLLPSRDDDSRRVSGHSGGVIARSTSRKRSSASRVKRQKISHTEDVSGTPLLDLQGEEMLSSMEPDSGQVTNLASSTGLQIEQPPQEGVSGSLLGNVDFSSTASSLPIVSEGVPLDFLMPSYEGEGVSSRPESPPPTSGDAATGWPSIGIEGVDGDTNPIFDELLLSPDVMWSSSLSAGPEVPESSAAENIPHATATGAPELNFDDLMTIDGKGLLYFLDPERE
ncbi:hypothetical protein FOZ62_001342 [Perkinsus olseni]|uniref:Uncharacterized protein n=1 Tax=Perkinsus olseni TaxID=32597 RepID=A0A7J6U1J5_PEROL|nr:hypothetical protein FOZ62_001342 [Perkinsus olseni]